MLRHDLIIFAGATDGEILKMMLPIPFNLKWLISSGL
jgi:hypothetical protein